VTGATVLGLIDAGSGPTWPAVRAAVERGAVSALFVLHPGPAEMLPDAEWIAEARASGRLGVLVVQATEESPLSKAADVVLPGATWLEKDGAYSNMQGRLQAVSQAILPFGEAREDWTILSDLAAAAGAAESFASVQAVREEIARLLEGEPAVGGLVTLGAERPRAARHWLQASNPSERWKWDFLFQDLPPVKFHNLHAAGESAQSQVIPLKPVK
jgi:anaerobic selenocysteine-containing dehydrogenase